MPIVQSRRRFLTNAALAGAAGLAAARVAGFGTGNKLLAAEPAPEITTIRISKIPTDVCVAAQYVAEELLQAEGFADIQYVELTKDDFRDSENRLTKVGLSKIDFNVDFAADLIAFREKGDPIAPLSGLHVGCTELFARENIKGIGDLKGRTVGVRSTTSKRLLTIMAAYVGLDPVKDIQWVRTGPIPPKDLFIEGKIDAFLAGPPQTQQIRALNIGHVIVNSSIDRPWSQYFCCVLWAKTDFVQSYPVATKRALRAILKATDICASEPRRVARSMVDRGFFTTNYDYILQALNEIPYGIWRDVDPEDSLRFYALRMHETGLIKSTPQQITEGIDWRLINELKRELKV
jgi:NitT/TauT family transport system substrate-binding protein